MVKVNSLLVLISALVLCISTATVWKAPVRKAAPLDTISVNPFHIHFKKENGYPIDFMIGESLDRPFNILISVNAPYELTTVDVILVRGKYPISQKRYTGLQQIVVNKDDFFSKAVAGDRICIRLLSISKNNNQFDPVVLDMPVYNIPLY